MADKKYLATWETSCGKHFVKLYETNYAGKKRFYYDTRTGGGNVGDKAPTLEGAIRYVETLVVPFIAQDHKSLRRVI